MKYLKNHISVILTLFILLFSVQFSVIMYRIIQNQNQKMLENYSIVIVAQNKLKIEAIKSKIPQADSLSLIESKKITDKLKNTLSTENLSMLKIILPYFYSLKLNTLLNDNQLSKIKKTLLSFKGISRVEIFTKSYESAYHILQILQIITFVFSLIIIFMSILLLLKHIKIWMLEHEEKIKIMEFFGANYWMKSAFLYKLVFVDSMISIFFVILIYLYLPKNEYIHSILTSLDVRLKYFISLYDIGILFSISLILSLFIVAIVSKKAGK